MFDTDKLFKKRLRFVIQDDLTLFKLVKTYDPFQHKDKWNEIQRVMQKNTGKPFSVRTIRERVTHLIKRYVTEDLKYNKAYATPEQWKAKTKLLADIVNLRIQAVSREGLSLNNSNQYDNAPTDDYGDAASPLPINDFILVKVESGDEPDDNDNHNTESFDNDVAQDNDDSFDEDDEKPVKPPQSKKPKLEKQYRKILPKPPTNTETVVTKTEKPEALEYLTNRHQDELSLKTRQLAVEEKRIMIQERQLALEREKFNLQKMERTQRLEVELKERELHMKVLEQQQQMISMLLEQNRQG